MSEANGTDRSEPTTRDAFLGGRLILMQPAKGYRAGLDAVLLAAAAPATPGAHVVDLGAGVGTAGLCVATRVPSTRVSLVERDPAMADLAARNIADNGLSQRAQVLVADVTAPLSRNAAVAALLGTADVVIANPPYALAAEGTRSPDAQRDAAHVMATDTLDAWVRAMAAFGHADACGVIIHRADALPRVLAAFAVRYGNLVVRPVSPRADAPAHRILVSGRKGSGAPLRLMPPLVLHGASGRYRDEIDAILRDGAAIADHGLSG